MFLIGMTPEGMQQINRWLSDAYRACWQPERRKWIVFVSVVLVMPAVTGEGTYILVKFMSQHSLCHVSYCDQATTHRDNLYMNGIGWAIFATLMSVSIAVVFRLARHYRFHEDILSAMTYQGRIMTYRSRLSYFSAVNKAERLLYRGCWFFIVLGFAGAITMIWLACLAP